MNALGIGANAEDIYAIRHYEYRYDPYAELGEWDYVIYKYDHGANRWVRQTARTQSGLNVPYIAGAVQLNTGMFYFGTYDAPGNVNTVRQLRFRLYRFDPRNGSTQYLGSFATGRQLAAGEPYNSAANGDMAFDDQGNLFVVRSGTRSYGSSIKETSIHSITADALARANGGNIPASSTAPIRTDESVNGIAFDAHGRLYLGDATTVRQHDPIDYENLGVFKSGLTGSRDLASCASPATFRLRKNVEARHAADDQFVLNLTKNGPGGKQTVIPSVTTTGNRDGLQAETIGVFPVRTGTQYTFSENMASSSPSAAGTYRSTWRCVDKSAQIAAGEGRSGSVVIPNAPSAEVICTFTNTPLSGSLVWEKVDSEERNTRLAGSVWTISGPLARGRSGTVKDCVVANASQCRAEDNDTDPRAGYFKVDNLYLGRYTLRETTPPSGYEGTTQTFTQTLDADKQQRSFGKIDNKRLVAQIQVTKEVRDPSGGKVANASGWTMSVDLATRLNGTLSPLKDRNNPWFGKHQVSDASGAVPEQWTVAFPNSTSTQDIRITEAPKPSSYQASIRCTSNKRQPVEAAGNGLNIAAVTPGEKFLCVVTNKQLPGSVVWEKTDASGTYLSGSEWSVTTTQQGVITVKDCVRAGACQNGGDRDPRPGRFRLEGLKWQEVTLEETAAPPGYRRNTEVLRRTIGENALQANFGRITNETVTLPLLPLTGGMGADSFLMAGAGILILAVGAALMRRLQLAGVSSLATQSLYGDKTERG
ncbi:prealbumin-like fold domain-containing protein [Schaalia sp. Marseille-Q2122]|uniref:prealbumin-like fold domain-containing protein n=1 Tax=Schaalia sp. Marseille-Q2122 TaxID=2736604 RepID=UPI00158C8776|nr:prealbumin-like fold domain-containing protein [Schaalia sp. Marseille-Q2122]